MAFSDTAAVRGTYVVADAPADERVAFIKKTYAHLAGAIGLFVLLEYILLHMSISVKLIQLMLGTHYSWLVVLGLFMAVGWLANWWAMASHSKALQYAGLILYVVAEAIIFLPLLYVAAYYTSGNVIPTAAILTLGLTAGLTAIVFITKKDFSFLRGALVVGGLVAAGLIVASFFVSSLDLGVWFSVAMILLAGGYILYYTSNVLHHYHPDQYVAASLALFAAVALLFWYILRLLIQLQGRD